MYVFECHVSRIVFFLCRGKNTLRILHLVVALFSICRARVKNHDLELECSLSRHVLLSSAIPTIVHGKQRAALGFPRPRLFVHNNTKHHAGESADACALGRGQQHRRGLAHSQLCLRVSKTNRRPIGSVPARRWPVRSQDATRAHDGKRV